MENNTEIMKDSSSLPETTKSRFNTVSPEVDIFENDKEYLIVADMPGVTVDALNVKFDVPNLFIEGHQSLEDDMARQSNVLPISFERTFQMPQIINSEAISADLKDGVLRVHLTKSEKASPVQIAVKKQ